MRCPGFREAGWLVSLALAGGMAAANEKDSQQRGLTYMERDGEALKCDLFLPAGDGSFPAVLVVHGGAWMSGSRSQMTGVATTLAQHGYAACAIDYRLAPKHPFPAQIEDCKSAIRWLRTHAEQFKIDPDKVGGYGYSAGGHLVALLGTTDPDCGLEGSDATPNSPSARIQCVVAGGAPCEFRALPPNNRRLAYWLGGTRAEKPQAYELASPLRFVSKDDPPCFFFHGEADRLVPLESPQAMVRELDSVGVPAVLFTLRQAGHLEAFLDTGATASALEFLDKHLKGGRRFPAEEAMMLDREEYVEQAHFYQMLKERIAEGIPTQDLLASVREEILATTKLPMAIDFMAGELTLCGVFATAMAKLPHYFTPFQTFVVAEAENDRGKFDLPLALDILAREANYHAEGASPQGLFLYQFESVARNRLGYDRGLAAMAADPIYDEPWRDWILTIRRQIGLADVADLIYVRSEHYVEQQARLGRDPDQPPRPVLFGVREGRIALANRRKDPMLLFAALHRQLGYPEIPRRKPIDQTPAIVPVLLRRVERLETRLKLLEDEQKGGIDITKFYGPPPDEK